MNAREDLFEDLVAISAERKHSRKSSSFGSGRLIAPKLVLTAGHVVDCVAGAEATGRLRVHLLRDRESDPTRWVEGVNGQVVWRDQRDLDLALIALTDHVAAPCLSVRLAKFNGEGALTVTASGFPRASTLADGTSREYRVPGQLHIVRRDDPLVIAVEAAFQPTTPQGWQGMSGATVLARLPGRSDRQYALFGVVREVPREFTGGQLEIAECVAAFADRQFVAILSRALGQDASVFQWTEPQLYGRREGIGDEAATQLPLAAHIEVASKLLGEPDAKRFLHAMQSSLGERHEEEDRRVHFSQADRLCRWVGTCSPPVIIVIFDCILSCMQAVRTSRRVSKAERDAAADAGIALYCLAACSLVDRAGDEASAAHEYVRKLPHSPRVVHAVIAAAFFGGVIKLIDDDGEPDAPNVMRVRLPAGTENAVMVLECCIYAQLLQRDGRAKAASELIAKPRPLSAEELAKLLERLRYFRDIEHMQLTVVIGDHYYEQAAAELSRDRRLPMLVEHAEAVNVVQGMTAAELAGKLDTLWYAAKLLRSGSSGGR